MRAMGAHGREGDVVQPRLAETPTSVSNIPGNDFAVVQQYPVPDHNSLIQSVLDAALAWKGCPLDQLIHSRETWPSPSSNEMRA